MALGKQVIGGILQDNLRKGNEKHKRGVFTNERNYAIACRLFYHSNIRGLRYDRALKKLNEEFYLSELRIAQILMDDRQRDLLKKLKAENTCAKSLSKLFPQYNWNSAA